MRAEIEHRPEILPDFGKALDELACRFVEQGVMHGEVLRRLVAMRAHQSAIEYLHLAGTGHWATIAGPFPEPSPMSLAIPSRLRQFSGRALDFLLPPLCLSCDAPTSAHRTLCAKCWGKIHFIARPFCAACGAPFEVPMGGDTLCAGCIAEPPHFATARAPMLYDDFSKRIVLSFKYADRIYPAPALAGWMHRAGVEFWERADFILPVPLHRWRLFGRRYNQAALLVLELAKIAQKPTLIDALTRKRATPIQGHLGRKQRQANVKGAFRLNPRYRARIKDKSVVLVDDVLTTGATVNECARVLLRAGAKEVNALVLARVKGLL
jgi:ComF family protein